MGVVEVYMSLRAKARIGMPAVFAAAVLGCVAGAGMAQDAEHDWGKEYAVGASPSLSIETGDSGLELRSCGACQAIRIRVHTDGNLSRYTLQESQSGNAVSFSLKEKPHIGGTRPTRR